MKKILSILMITALSVLAFNASAQVTVVNNDDVNIYMTQTVKQNSYHKYTITPGSTTSKITWTVSGGTDGKFYSDNTGTEFTPSDRTTTVYLKWNEPAAATVYTVLVKETSAAGCSDEKVNTNKIDVTIDTNDFTATLAWDNGTTPECAIDGDQSFTFNLGVIGFKVGANCTYKYKVGTSETEKGTISWDPTPINGDFTPANVDLSVTKRIESGDGQYYIWVEVLEVFDGYNTPMSNTQPLIAKAIINKIPKAADISVD